MTNPVHAQRKWASITFDNDIFVGNDNGYSNGLYFSKIEGGSVEEGMPESDIWVKPLLWSMPRQQALGAVNSYTFGQAMNTPDDITEEVPDAGELPYSAMLFLNNTYLAVHQDFTDKVGLTIGVVGPIALGEEAQTLVHAAIGADEPKGWDNQIENELVFQFSRARLWRNWRSISDRADFLTYAEFNLGTVWSSVDAGFMMRYGKNLGESYMTPLLSGSRTSNPAAIDNGWYVFAGATAGYTFNQIFTDGNTFRDSLSIDYDPKSAGVTLGLAYAWTNFSLTFAVNDGNVIQSGDTEEALKDLTQFGTMTIAWRR